MCLVTQTGDPIKGVYNTKAGGSTGGFEGRYSPYTEKPLQVIDNDVTTKYFNYGTTSVMNANISQHGIDSGFHITPSLANGLIFTTGGEYPERDPITITLEGTNSTALNSSSIWTLLYNGSTGIDAITVSARQTYGTLQKFSNSFAYRSYRLLNTSQRSYQDSVQYAEAHIMTYC